jgi:hypothetical protein
LGPTKKTALNGLQKGQRENPTKDRSSASYRKNWLAALDDFRNWLIREAA